MQSAPIHVVVDQLPQELWTILAPLVLSAVVVATTIYYAWETHKMRQLGAAEQKRRDREDRFRAESARIMLSSIAITLDADMPVLNKMRSMEAWTDREMDRLLAAAPAMDDFTATDLEVVLSLLKAMRAVARQSIQAGSLDYDDGKQWLNMRLRLKDHLDKSFGVVVRGET